MTCNWCEVSEKEKSIYCFKANIGQFIWRMNKIISGGVSLFAIDIVLPFQNLR